MFAEITEESWKKLKEKLDSKGYAYEVSDCTLPGDSQPHVHIEFSHIGMEKATEIANYIDTAYVIAAQEAKVQEQEEDKETSPRKERHWDDKYHGIIGEAVGFMTGKNMEETDEYGR